MEYGMTKVVLCNDAVELGRQAASDVGSKIRELLDHKEEIRIIFAAG